MRISPGCMFKPNSWSTCRGAKDGSFTLPLLRNARPLCDGVWLDADARNLELVEDFAIVNHRTLESVIGRLRQPELRRCLDREWADPMRRRKLLIRLTDVLHTRQKQEAIALIKNTVAAQVLPRQGRVHTVPQMERAALRTFETLNRFGKPRRDKGASYRSTLTKRMHQRKAELEDASAKH